MAKDITIPSPAKVRASKVNYALRTARGAHSNILQQQARIAEALIHMEHAAEYYELQRIHAHMSFTILMLAQLDDALVAHNANKVARREDALRKVASNAK